MTEIQNRIVGIVGRKGSGKSTRVKDLLRYCERFVVFDVMGEHAASHWKKHGSEETTKINHVDKPAQLASFLKWSRGQETFACAYVPRGDLAEEIEAVSRLVYQRGELAFIVEEVPLYSQAGYMPPTFGRLVRTGRHHKIDVCWMAQRAAEVPKSVTALTDIWILFSQVEPRDLDALAYRCGRDVAGRVAKLGLHDYFLWDAVSHREIEDSPRLLKRVAVFPKRSRMDASTREWQRLGGFAETETWNMDIET